MTDDRREREVYRTAFSRELVRQWRWSLLKAAGALLVTAFAAIVTWKVTDESPLGTLAGALAVFAITGVCAFWNAVYSTGFQCWKAAMDVVSVANELRLEQTKDLAVSRARTQELERAVAETPVAKTIRALRRLNYGGHDGADFLVAAQDVLNRKVGTLTNLAAVVRHSGLSPHAANEHACALFLHALTSLRVLDKRPTAQHVWDLTPDLGHDVLLELLDESASIAPH